MNMTDKTEITQAEYLFDTISFWSKWGLIGQTSPIRMIARDKLYWGDLRFELQRDIIEKSNAFLRDNQELLSSAAASLDKSSTDQFIWDFYQKVSKLPHTDPLASKVEQMWTKCHHLVHSSPQEVICLLALEYINHARPV